ncbi:MAG: single-stranded DNA-binding protein [Solirubrobacterales bacterium]
MEDINSVVISGNLTKDPELVPNGSSICRLRVAVNGRRKVNDEWVDKPNYFDVTCFGKAAENHVKYLRKGRGVVVEGRLDWREWEAKDESGKRQAVQIIGEKVKYLSSKKDSEEERKEEEKPESEEPTEQLAAVGAGSGDGEEEEIPF